MPVPSRCVDSSSTAPTSLVSISKVFLVHWLRCRSSIIAGNGLTARTATQLIATLLHQTSLPRPIAITLDDGTKLDSADASIASLPREIREGTFTDALTFVAELKKGSEPTYRHKIMLVGHQAVGKTSLLHAMFPLSALLTEGDKKHVSVSLHGSYLTIRRGDVLSRLHLTATSFALEVRASRIILQSRATTGSVDAHVLTFVEEINEMPRKECKTQALVNNSVILDFAASFDQYFRWLGAISHWLANNATDGIDTRQICVNGPFVGAKSLVVPALDLRVMDFAGQQEYVLCLCCVAFHMLADTLPATASSSTTAPPSWFGTSVCTVNHA